MHANALDDFYNAQVHALPQTCMKHQQQKIRVIRETFACYFSLENEKKKLFNEDRQGLERLK